MRHGRCEAVKPPVLVARPRVWLGKTNSRTQVHLVPWQPNCSSTIWCSSAFSAGLACDARLCSSCGSARPNSNASVRPRNAQPAQRRRKLAQAGSRRRRTVVEVVHLDEEVGLEVPVLHGGELGIERVAVLLAADEPERAVRVRSRVVHEICTHNRFPVRLQHQRNGRPSKPRLRAHGRCA